MTDETILSFRDLDAWKVSMELVLTVYAAAAHLPVSERYEISPQIRRAVVSIPSNVAEGQAFGRHVGRGRYLHHVKIALGSHAEVVTLVEVIKRLRLIPPNELGPLEEQLTRAGQLLHGLRRSLVRKQLRAVTTRLALFGGSALLLLFPVFR